MNTQEAEVTRLVTAWLGGYGKGTQRGEGQLCDLGRPSPVYLITQVCKTDSNSSFFFMALLRRASRAW